MIQTHFPSKTFPHQFQAFWTKTSSKTLPCSTFRPWQKLGRCTVMCLSGCDTVTHFFLHIELDRSPRRLGWLYPQWMKSPRTTAELLSFLPHCQLKRPSVRLIRAGGGPSGLLIKVMSCKIKWEGSDSRLLPATLSFIVSAWRGGVPLYLLPPVTESVFVYVDKPLTARRQRERAQLQLCSHLSIDPSLLAKRQAEQKPSHAISVVFFSLSCLHFFCLPQK